MYHKAPRRDQLIRSGAIVATLLLAAGCSQSATPPTPTDLPSPTAIKVDLPQAVFPDGFVVDLEIAVTPQEVADGLMYRPKLPEARGMLFIFDGDRFPSFWMKNTLISLDLVFLDGTGTVVDITANVPPCAADPCPTYSPKNAARAVLEVVAGAAAAHDLEIGSAITFTRVPGYPTEPTDETTVTSEP